MSFSSDLEGLTLEVMKSSVSVALSSLLKLQPKGPISINREGDFVAWAPVHYEMEQDRFIYIGELISILGAFF